MLLLACHYIINRLSIAKYCLLNSSYSIKRRQKIDGCTSPLQSDWILYEGNVRRQNLLANVNLNHRRVYYSTKVWNEFTNTTKSKQRQCVGM